MANIKSKNMTKNFTLQEITGLYQVLDTKQKMMTEMLVIQTNKLNNHTTLVTAKPDIKAKIKMLNQEVELMMTWKAKIDIVLVPFLQDIAWDNLKIINDTKWFKDKSDN